MVSEEEWKILSKKWKGLGERKCRICNTADAVVRKYGLYICRRCLYEYGEEIGFRVYE